MAHGPEPAWRLLEGGHEARLPGRGMLDSSQIRSARARKSWLALRAILRVEDREPKEVGHVLTRYSRARHPELGHDRPCSESGRLGRVLSQPSAQTVDADRGQRPRIWQA